MKSIEWQVPLARLVDVAALAGGDADARAQPRDGALRGDDPRGPRVAA